jgi:transcription antitermination factor NusG
MKNEIVGVRWYALQVRVNYETVVSSSLRTRGVEDYLPIRHREASSARSRFSLGIPLFPGYVFAHLDLQSGPRLFTIPGVIRIVGHGRQAIPIDDEEIESIRSVVNSPLPLEPMPYFRAGEKVAISNGPLAGATGTYIRSIHENKFVVSLTLLQRALAVVLPSDWVIPETVEGYCQ